jgi:hypothetical protein
MWFSPSTASERPAVALELTKHGEDFNNLKLLVVAYFFARGIASSVLSRLTTGCACISWLVTDTEINNLSNDQHESSLHIVRQLYGEAHELRSCFRYSGEIFTGGEGGV